MGLLRGSIIVAAIFLAIGAIVAGYEHNADLMTLCFSGILFLIIAESVLKIWEQGESILRMGVGMILGILVCLFVMSIPGIGILFGPLLGGLIVALFAGFKAGWDLLPTTLVTVLFVSAAMKVNFVFLIFEHILTFLGSHDALLNFIGTGAIFGILIGCVFLWIYLVIFCGIGALIGASFHPSPALPKNLKSQVEKLDEQYKKAKTTEEKEKIKQQASGLSQRSKIKQDLDVAKKTWAKSGKSDLRKRARKIKKEKGTTTEDLEKGLTTLLHDKIMPELKEYGYYDYAEKNCKKMGIQAPYSKSGWLGLVKTDLCHEIDRIIEEWKEEKKGDDG